MRFEIANIQDPELKWNEIDSITYYKFLHSPFHVSNGKEKGARGTMLIVIDVSMSYYKILLEQSKYNFLEVHRIREAQRCLNENSLEL